MKILFISDIHGIDSNLEYIEIIGIIEPTVEYIKILNSAREKANYFVNRKVEDIWNETTWWG